MKTSVNYWAVLICTVLNMVIGMLWYSPMMLGLTWAKAGGISLDHVTPTAGHYLGAVAVSFLVAWALAQVLARGAKGIGQSIVLGLIVWLGFITSTHFSGVIWAGVPILVYLVNVGCILVQVVVNSTVLAVWRK